MGVGEQMVGVEKRDGGVKSQVTKRSKLCIQVTPRSLAADIPLCAKSNTRGGVESYVCDARRSV